MSMVLFYFFIVIFFVGGVGLNDKSNIEGYQT